ncbi:MAG TPA: 2-hydroxyacyl-CoA dehydratase family protein [Phycisphaerae bacterium]|nr:2-hydroxyacyl-CoA dehydratase family protein [Phycisphaerae bacterium]
MKTVLSTCPYVPPEWVAAHDLRLRRFRPGDARSAAGLAGGAGVCPYARDVLRAMEAASVTEDTAGVVITTVCDQMRRAAGLLPGTDSRPVLLMNVPTTWQTPAGQQIYVSELRRLGRFLVSLGGRAPDDRRLADTMVAYDQARFALKECRRRCSGSRFSRLLAEFDEQGPGVSFSPSASGPADAVKLALVGGPLWAEDAELFEIIESLGGNVVLDATTSGELVMPDAYDRSHLADRPLEEMARVYGRIPDAFRRPNRALFEWLGRELAARGVQGIVFRTCLWCDTWVAELVRIREGFGLPVLHLDVDGATPGCRTRISGRLQAFMEVLR